VKRGREAEGFTVEVALDGHDGLWMATEGAYDLVILDIMLPGRNGYQICADLREAGNWTPILMLTAKAGDLDQAEALDTEADDYLTKPFSFPVLWARRNASTLPAPQDGGRSRPPCSGRRPPCCGCRAIDAS
jgi:DNA-binding response OmpR family regulator